eukprot:TRINITY_DN2754_c0_g1_i2.p1 TRINITY_DN2754_c0_g1~~TRINITY_DN2754_c0_g1_i2.p1  ORF type:complete len:560 (+),score=95.21 TRINITY_DN2754_c0_g1_i2:190-1869(+)
MLSGSSNNSSEVESNNDPPEIRPSFFQGSNISGNFKKFFFEGGSDHETSFLQLAYSFSIIFLFPLGFTFGYLLLPLQPVMPGLKYNWVFAIECFLNLVGILCVHIFWGKYYYHHVWWSPLIFAALMTDVVVCFLLEFWYPTKFLAFIGAAVITVMYPVGVTIRAKIARVEKDPDFIKGKKKFLIVRSLNSLTVIFSWVYLVLFLLLPRLQELFSLLYAGVVFLLKYGFVLHTHASLSKEFNGIGAFQVELFHSIFILFSFPSSNNWVVIILIVVIQLSSSIMTWVSLSDWWWNIVSSFIRRRSRSNQIAPSEQSTSSIELQMTSSFNNNNNIQIVPENSPNNTRISSSENTSTSNNTLTASNSNTSNALSNSNSPSTSPSAIFPLIPNSPSNSNTLHRSHSNTTLFNSNNPLSNSDTITLSSSSSPMIKHPSQSEISMNNKENFVRGMIKASSLSLLAQFLSPFFYIPLAFFIRYGYNNKFFPYHLLTEAAFNQALIYSVVSSLISLTTLLLMAVAIKKRFNINLLTDLLLPVISQKRFFISTVILGFVIRAILSIKNH